MPKSALDAEYSARHSLLEDLRANLQDKLETALDGLSHIDRIAVRVKERQSFIRKASLPKYIDPWAELEDLVAARVIVFFRKDLELVDRRIGDWLTSVEYEKKRPEHSSQFDYESDHYVVVLPEHWKPTGWASVGPMPTTFELQLRTIFMHAWAEPQHDLGYKTQGGTALDHDSARELAWVAASCWGADKALNDVADRLGAFSRLTTGTSSTT